MTRSVITMASRRAAPTTPAQGNHDPVQLHADAHNSVALAAYYLAKGSNKAAQRKLGQAMAAMRALDKVEG
ncbi:hypothetical protein EC845_2544 [Comamonas sp. BIGb0124]|uniref:hypothetical protein n=1 Tax=Comamonas sp. BIGb0124 TaxID=2485130 RepID=UPI000F9EF87D|nr:hypothetical protein [Comamonas sp. BIGb0124]ROR21721.1 hypothetical protein EC845_2544 [Comamonas sp. BIGb0124]